MAYIRIENVCVFSTFIFKNPVVGRRLNINLRWLNFSSLSNPVNVSSPLLTFSLAYCDVCL